MGCSGSWLGRRWWIGGVAARVGTCGFGVERCRGFCALNNKVLFSKNRLNIVDLNSEVSYNLSQWEWRDSSRFPTSE